MKVEVIVDKKYENTNIIIYTNKMTDEINNIVEKFSDDDNQNIIVGYKDNKLFLLDENNIETVYAELGKVIIRCNDEEYISKKRLYELEEILNKNNFIRVSKSEIVNFKKVKNIDYKVIGTLILNFKSGNKSYVSRRYISSIKDFLKI